MLDSELRSILNRPLLFYDFNVSIPWNCLTIAATVASHSQPYPYIHQNMYTLLPYLTYMTQLFFTVLRMILFIWFEHKSDSNETRPILLDSDKWSWWKIRLWRAPLNITSVHKARWPVPFPTKNLWVNLLTLYHAFILAYYYMHAPKTCSHTGQPTVLQNTPIVYKDNSSSPSHFPNCPTHTPSP